MTAAGPIRRLIGVSLNAAIDKVATVDRLEVGHIHRPDLLTTLPGGKAINAARAADRLGLAAEVVAVIGGHSGSWLEDALAQRDIPGRYVRVDGESRTCLSILDRSTGILTEFYEAGITLPAERWSSVEDALRTSLAKDAAGSVVLLAGSLPAGAPVDAYRRLAVLAAEAGARVVLDVGGEPLRLGLEAAPWIVKINATEAAAATGLPEGGVANALEAAHRLCELGAQQALVTMGVEGSVLISAGRSWRVGPPPERGPYSVGSGDAFVAGLLSALARGADLPGALRLAAAAGAANALIPGQGELDPVDVERLAAACEVVPLRIRGPRKAEPRLGTR